MAQQHAIDVSVATLEVDDPNLSRVYRKIYEIVMTIDHPSILRVFSVSGRAPLRILVEEFSPLPRRALSLGEASSLREGIRILESHGIIMTRILRGYLGWANGNVKLCLFADAGIVSPTSPYKWKVEPLTLNIAKKMMRGCDFDAYISGVYKLSELTACAERRFFMANAARRKRELRKRKSTTKRDSARDEFRIRHFLQTGNDLEKISTPALRKYLGATQEKRRQELQSRLMQQRAERNRRRLQQIHKRQQKSKTLILTQETDPEEIRRIEVLDPILYQERPLGQILTDPDSDYRILLVRGAGGITRPALYENKEPEIVYRCVDGRRWQDYKDEQSYFYNIRTFEGDSYLIPRMTLPRVLVIEPTDDTFRVISRGAILDDRGSVMLDFESRLHCQAGSERRLHQARAAETQRVGRLLQIKRQQTRPA